MGARSRERRSSRPPRRSACRLPPASRRPAPALPDDPAPQRVARPVSFRRLRRSGKKEDAVTEFVAVARKWFLRATATGKDVGEVVCALAACAARQVRSGRKVWGEEQLEDVLAPLRRQRRTFVGGKLADVSTETGKPLHDAPADDTRSPAPDQVCFRSDFPAWRASLGQRNRRIAEDRALGRRTQDLSARRGVSPGRLSQLRHAFVDGWKRFWGDVE